MLSQEALANYLKAVDSGATIGPRPADPLVPLSFGQEQVWLHASLAPDLPLYNETLTIKCGATLNVEALEKSLNEVVRRHEAWRTTIALVDGEPFQAVHASLPVPFQHMDLTSLPEHLRDAEAVRLATGSATQLFDLERGPLLRALVITLADTHHRLYLTLHHLIFDGASMRQVFFPEFVSLYSSFSQGKRPSLPELDLQYGDFAYWQAQGRVATMESSAPYWRAQLTAPPVLALPTDHPRPATLSFRGASRNFQFGEALTSALKECIRREQVTLFNMLFASFALLLGRLCAQEDVIVGVHLAAKTHREVEPILGYFSNTVIFRADLSGDPQLQEFLSRIKEVTIGALSHAEVPFQDVVREMHPLRDGGTPIFRTLFSMAPPVPEISSEWSLGALDIFNGNAKEDLDVELDDRGDRIYGRIYYKADLFDAPTVDRFVDSWTTLLTAIVEDTSRRISDLPVISKKELRWLIHDLNQSHHSYPADCIHQLISDQAKLVPDAVAIQCNGEQLTYRDLDAKATQLAHYLRSRGAAPGALVALCVDRSLDMVISPIAILKTGAAYVPLDPNYPAERLTSMLDASGASLFVSHSSLRSRFNPSGVEAVYLDSAREIISVYPQQGPLPIPVIDASAYIIFTSGSTGQPKGVDISHRNLLNLLWSMRREPGISPTDRLLSVTSICFDIAALEIFLPLMVGAQLVLAISEEVADPNRLLSRFHDSQATIMQATPVTWRLLIEAGWTGSDHLTVLCGGEAMTQQLASALLQRSKSLWNMYGPTETTIWSACERITSSETFLPIGRPIANTALYVLDDHRRLAPTGVPGELYIGGDGLARGYWRQPDLTIRQFPIVSLPDGSRTRLYKTGDRVRRHSDGSIEFLGRLDKQVKIRGFRIELGEVEHALNRFPGVRAAVALKEPSEDGDGTLAAYVLLHAEELQSMAKMRTHLQRILPSYMQPSEIYIVDKLPTTLNGKVDRKTLPNAPRRIVVDSQLPITPIEADLAAIWCKLLDIQSVGRNDSFFDLGGHSTLAARLIARITAAFGKRVALTSFIQTPTIAHLAQLLAGNEVSHVAVVNKGSASKVPLIWVGPTPWQPRLTTYLSAEQPVLSFLLTQEELASTAPHFRLEDMAALMVKKIRYLRPGAAYALAGFCQTSLLAYECAKRLQDLGHEIPLLVMGDVVPPGYFRCLSFAERSKRRLEREAFYLSAMRHSLPSHWKDLFAKRIGGFRLMQEQRRWEKFYRSSSKDPQAVQEMYQALLIAQLSYAPSPYSGRVLFLQSGNRPQSNRRDEIASWEGLLDEQEVFESPGDHTSIFEEPHVSVVAQRIQLALDSAVDEAICSPKALA
jgi:amino acid adenylation domain-containing protein